ncbi:ATP-binding cassette domain-containing protein [Mobilicoccus pelagius]|uniref:Putative ABC transporter ATP-binding protein n=1 Tax=Mobilicoccus pelagius NBRC 104925 TaxID=1089455 RepID=H5UPX4_9MICO|nr:ATP-binding cassette domain-containing protein [Mobilicoccus pelagius]GAB47779.1 putative ABC transporter ATP-binding protein [Mobilicoccus pelagius NBRC 104925]
MEDPVLVARDLMADGSQGRIFGPVDLALYPRQMCVVTGPSGSGRSSLLLALCGRFRPATGSLEIAGVDAMARPYDALEHTTIARLGDFVGPEDRLTLEESILDRAYIEGVDPEVALARADHMAEVLGVRGDSKALLEDMEAFDRAVVAVALALVRPASIIALDDADMRIRHRDLPRLYSALQRLIDIDGAALVVSVSDDDCMPEGSVVVPLGRDVAPAFEPIPEEAPEGDPTATFDAAAPEPSLGRHAAPPGTGPGEEPASPQGPHGPGRHEAPGADAPGAPDPRSAGGDPVEGSRPRPRVTRPADPDAPSTPADS